MCVEGPKRYLRGSLRRALAGSNSSPGVPDSSTPPRVAPRPPLCPLCSVAIIPDFPLSATAVQTSCTHYIFSSGPRRVLIIFLRRTLCYLSPWHLQRWAARPAHSPLTGEITHYLAPLPLPTLSIDWLFNSGVVFVQSDIIYTFFVLSGECMLIFSWSAAFLGLVSG